ncbi:hypothetical protein KIPB_004553 [Kipferlia bialata]|uniref:Uncharacterized protein n=1 Tax=Kipferlia bialata TaxID=797122 RepID=A0A9K3GIC5_9EUKA|nr:hypothetical protein KIPB_004553 [Kipferlia bialata]|eukprot:g4553.t1
MNHDRITHDPEVILSPMRTQPRQDTLAGNPNREGVRHGPETDRLGRPVEWLPCLPRLTGTRCDELGVTPIGLDKVLCMRLCHPGLMRQQYIGRVRHGDPLVSWEWRTVTPMPEEMAGFTVNLKGARIGDNVYFPIFPHPPGVDATMGLVRLDLTREEWVIEGRGPWNPENELNQGPPVMYNCLVEAYGQSLVVAGGSSIVEDFGQRREAKEGAWRYDTDFQYWERLGDIPADTVVSSESSAVWVGRTLHTFTDNDHLSLTFDGQ